MLQKTQTFYSLNEHAAEVPNIKSQAFSLNTTILVLEKLAVKITDLITTKNLSLL